jgi:hypothetical protein
VAVTSVSAQQLQRSSSALLGQGEPSGPLISQAVGHKPPRLPQPSAGPLPSHVPDRVRRYWSRTTGSQWLAESLRRIGSVCQVAACGSRCSGRWR